MGSTAFIGLGTIVEFASVAVPTTFTQLNGCTEASFSGGKVATEKTTNLNSTSGYETYTAGPLEGGSMSAKCQHLPADATQIALFAIMNARLPVNFKVVYPSGQTRQFSGIVEAFDPATSFEKVSMRDLKIKVTGPIIETLS